MGQCCCKNKQFPEIKIKGNALCNENECSCLSKCCIKTIKKTHHSHHHKKKENTEIYG